MDSYSAEVIKKSHPDHFYFLDFYLGGIVFFVLGFFTLWPLSMVGILIFALAEVCRLAETFYIFENGVAREYKLFSTAKEFCEYKNIQNTKVSQSFIERIFGIGSIHFDTAGGDTKEVSFHGIKNPYEIESIIHEKMKQ